MKRFVLHTFLTLLLALGFGGSLFARKIVFNAAYDRAEYDLTKESVRIRVTNGNLALNISSDGKIYRYSTYLVKSGGALVFEVLSDNEIITEISIEYEGGSSHTFQCCKTEDKWTNPSSYSAKISKITVTLMSLISDLSELELLYGRLGREYLIHTKKEARGSLGVANGELASTNPKAQGHKCDEAMPFLIHPFNDKYFLYSVTDDKFITKTGGETDRPLLDDLWTLTKNANGYFMFKVANNYLNVNNNPGIQINSRGEEETQWDDGNQFSIQPTDYTYSDISYIFYDRGSYFWPIDFLDDNVKAICVAKWDIDGDEELSEIEAASVTDLENVFRNTDITSFDELQYFTGLTSIDNEAFSGCSSLTSITIPESVTTIGNYAFSGCKSLTSITIPESVTNIGDHAFFGCSSLIWVPIPKNVTNISDYTFSGCESLEDVSIPKSVTNIGSHAFSGCESLECVFCYAEQVPNADESSFADSNMSGAVLFVPAVSYDAYRETAPWSNFGYIDPMTSIKLDRSELPLTYRGEKVQLHAIILPENATYEDVTWTSSNESVAVVDKNGNVTAVGNGTAVITAIFITDYENITVSCTVYVNIDYTIYATKIHLDQSQCIMNHEGEEVQLKATIEPEIATYKDVMWTSSNESVATVDENGLVTAVGNGDAVITATTIDGTNLSATCKVIVHNVVFKTFTLRCARGYVGYNGSALYGTTSKEAASEFAIVDYGDTNYLYDVTNKAFVIHSTAAMAGTNGNRSLESSTYFAAAVTGLTWGKTGFEDYPWYYPWYLEDCFGNWLNMDNAGNVYMNTWQDFEDGDGGNTYQVEIVNDWFVAYEALEMLDSYFDRNIISDLSELSNSKQYIICTKDEARGALGVANGELASTNPEAQGHKCEEASAFAILQYDGNYYLYSTADRKFITNTGGETDAPGLDGTHAVTVTKNANGGYFMFSFTSTGNVININDKPGIDINTWGQTEDNWDDGNQFTIDEAGDFDPTEALAMFVVDNTPNVKGKTFTLCCARGYVGYNGSTLCSTTQEAASEFAIVDYEDSNYLYDVTNKAFVIHTTAAKAGLSGNRLLESQTDFSKAVTGLSWGKTGIATYPWYLEDSFTNWLNMGSLKDVNMNTWKDFEGGNGGNTYQVEIVNENFDATEAIQMLDRYFHPISISSITLDTTSEVLTAIGKTVQLTPTVLPNDATNKNVVWSSSNTAVATVSETGLVNAVGSGTATITATAADGSGVTASCEVTVKIPVTSITLDTTSEILTAIGQTVQLTPTIVPDNATLRNVTWTSSNESVAVVDENGLVKALGNGIAVITATTVDGTNLSASCTVEVVDNTPHVTGKTFTLRCARGYVGYDGSTLCSTTQEAASEFAIVDYGTTNYLFDVTNKAFVVHSAAAMAGTEGNRSLESSTYFAAAVTGLTWGKTGYETYPWYLEDSFTNWMNMDGELKVCMNTWKDFEGGNGGNTYQVDIVSTSFDATEAIQMLDNYFQTAVEVTDEQYQAALNSVGTDTQYAIYTLKGGTRYYLTSEGYLTANPTKTCVLTFARTEGDGLFRSPGWKVDACFTNPQLSENGGESGALLPQGHILTDSQGRDDWEGQVWYSGDNGCYAVRATNAVSDTWGANTYWTVLDTNGDGVPEADYSWAPAFVWQLESDVVSVGIRDIDNGQAHEAGTWYMLDGRKLSSKPATKGIYIRNNQKVLVK